MNGRGRGAGSMARAAPWTTRDRGSAPGWLLSDGSARWKAVVHLHGARERVVARVQAFQPHGLPQRDALAGAAAPGAEDGEADEPERRVVVVALQLVEVLLGEE